MSITKTLSLTASITAVLSTLAYLLLSNVGVVDAAMKVNINQPMPASKHLDSIVLGGGCFWGAEKRYEAIPGVVDAVSGYADGEGVKPTYREITKWRNRTNPKNHAEVVKVTYNSSQIDLEVILREYFETHDPTQLNRQGNDIGTQYRSTILYTSLEQAQVIYKLRNQFQKALSKKGHGRIVTKIKPLQQFFSAEAYHQDYLEKNPNGYCPDHSTGVTFKDTPKKPTVNNAALLKGQQIVVIDSEGCTFCKKFKTDVVANYNKKTPITFRKASELKGLKLKTPTWATPTVLFLKNGKEVSGHQGYMKPEKFYAALDRFKFR